MCKISDVMKLFGSASAFRMHYQGGTQYQVTCQKRNYSEKQVMMGQVMREFVRVYIDHIILTNQTLVCFT